MKSNLLLVLCFAVAGCENGARVGGVAKADLAGPATTPVANDDGGAPFDPAGACVTATAKADVAYLPVDIIWLVDNSSSMQPAIDAVTEGLNQFASIIAGKNLDYHIIMVSLRAEKNPVSTAGEKRWGVCVPAPLAGDDHCGNGARFFHSSVDVKSTQPLEQLLGTLGQTDGFKLGDARGGEPWSDQLRAGATKTIVVVSDDDSRLTPDDFEHFAGGVSPFSSSNKLPPGLLDASWGGLFDGYIFDGIYGWGSDSDPKKSCAYADGSAPAKPGETYTQLVQRTSGVRAKICDSASAWSSFLDTVATAVGQNAKLSCTLPIPAPTAPAVLDPAAINVSIDDDSGATLVYKVAGASGCGAGDGWYYDDDANPMHVQLCSSSCMEAQARLDSGAHARIDVYFGCTTVIR